MPIDRPTLVLASSSPRRQETLRLLGLRFEVRLPEVDESPLAGESAHDYVARLAAAKAEVAVRKGEIVLAADTVVTLGDRLLGKPEDRDDAADMLRKLAAREHAVLTGVALIHEDRCEQAVASTTVRMARMSDEEIAWYVATGEPMDKAGAYAIQGLASLFVEEIQGNYGNVVGLPIPTVYSLFRRLGYDLLSFRS